MKKIVTASSALALLVAVPSFAHPLKPDRYRCDRVFTVAESMAKARHIYAGTRHVSLHDLRALGYRERCQRNRMAQPFVRGYDRRLDRVHKQRLAPPQPSSDGWSWPWSCIAQHESGGDPTTDTGNGFYGGLQFTMSTWLANGGQGNPASASIAEQEAVAERVLASQGWGAWPSTSRMCGL